MMYLLVRLAPIEQNDIVYKGELDVSCAGRFLFTLWKWSVMIPSRFKEMRSQLGWKMPVSNQ